jgi:hypothetical protein
MGKAQSRRERKRSPLDRQPGGWAGRDHSLDIEQMYLYNEIGFFPIRFDIGGTRKGIRL